MEPVGRATTIDHGQAHFTAGDQMVSYLSLLFAIAQKSLNPDDIRRALEAVTPSLRTIAKALLHNHHDRHEMIDDSTQAAYLAIIRELKLNKYTITLDVEPWLWTIMRNCCRQELRRAAKHVAVDLAEIGDVRAQEPFVLNDSSEGSRNDELVAEVGRRFTALPPTTQQIIWLYYFEGKSYRDIAQAKGIGRNTVSKLILKALRTLGKGLSLEDDHHEQ